MNDKNDIRGKYFRKYGIISLLVFEIVAFVVIGFFLGKFLDQKLETHHFLQVTGIIGGFVIGIYKFYKDTKRFLI